MAFFSAIAARWQLALGLAALLLLSLSVAYCEGRKDGRAVEQAKAATMEAERQAALASEEAALRKLAKETDRAVNQSRLAHAASVESFIRRGGVQPCPAGHIAKDRSAGDSAGVHQAPELASGERLQGLVTVLPDDVRICTDNTFKAEGLRDFVLGLEE